MNLLAKRAQSPFSLFVFGVLLSTFATVPTRVIGDDSVKEGRAAERSKSILLIAGKPSHGYGAHEHYAGLKVLEQSLLEANPNLKTEVVRGWPSDASKVESADSIVLYSDGQTRHVAFDHRDEIRGVLKRGGGLVCLHYATEMTPGESGDDMIELLGGHFEIHYSVNPHWIAKFDDLPDHPITSGVEPFATNDEWYFHLRFSERGKLTPILQSVAPEETMRRPDGAHSGNPHVRKSVAAGEPQTVAWAYEPEFGGRSFGFTGGHHHWNWSHVPVRRLVTNAIRWTAGDDPTTEANTPAPLSAEQLMADQDYEPPKQFDLGAIADKFEIPLKQDASSKPASPSQEDQSSNGRVQSQRMQVSSLVTTNTPGHQVELTADLSKLDAASRRRVFLVASEGGNDYSCDHVAWLSPMAHGDFGRLDLVDHGWTRATTGWGEVHANANCIGGSVRVDGQPRTEPSIGTHAPSVIAFDLPPGTQKITVTGALTNSGTDQNGGNNSSVRFAIFAGNAPSNPNVIDGKQADLQRSPEQAVAGLEAAEGLEVTLMGSEPILSSLTNLDIDHRGRVWVCDVMNYRRNNGARPEGDRILILEDTTGDGKLDHVHTYYQGRDIDSAMGICVLGNEVIVSASPTIWKFTDTDGDDIPDSKVALFTEVGQPQHDHSAHSFLFGDDGKLYWNFGNTGLQVKDANGETVVDIHGRAVIDNGQPLYGGMPFRCDLDGSNFEVLAHNFRNNWETTVDSFGALWQSDNDDDGNRGTRINFVMEQGNYGYRDERTGDSWRADRINKEAEIPLQHWHLNDPGVVPNMLQTGAGSPSGICVYEGRLLPERFWDTVIHCEPGVNIVRAYPTQPDGAGYSATIEPLLTGVNDQWFRPADVCVAPDGSLFVTDWYDPGVGGHHQKDSDRGRLFRLSPPGVKYRIPNVNLKTVNGLTQALANPNRSVRYMAWQKLHAMGADAEQALLHLYENENPRLKARALWLLGKIDGRGKHYVELALQDDHVDIRCTAIRLCKQLGFSPAELCVDAASDPSPAVRRELALALRYDQSSAMPSVWAKLARKYDGEDRWMLEALGIGSDVRSNECFAAWLAAVDGDWNTPAGRDLVWRMRTDGAASKMVDLLASGELNDTETARYFRSLEYHPDAVRYAELQRLLPDGNSSSKASPTTLVRSVSRMPSFDAEKFPKTHAAIHDYVKSRVDDDDFVKLVEQFDFRDLDAELIETMLQQDDNNRSLSALRLLLKRKDGWNRFVDVLAKDSTFNPTQRKRVMSLLGSLANGRAIGLLSKTASDEEMDYELRGSAVRGLAKSNGGSEELLRLAKEGRLPADTHLLAGGLLARNSNEDIAKRARQQLPQPAAADSKPLPPLDELVRASGDVERGMKIFRGVATCSNCHIVDGFGKQVGPDLSEIGSKLSREAMFTAILAPSAGISHNYENMIALTEDGRVVNGVLVTETDDKLVLRTAEAIDLEFDQADIVDVKKSEKSIMPENLHHTTDQQGLVDMVEYLMGLKKKT
ncbi:ThuA domain-containing protein [Rhodopirellula sp. JC740]|uniref:ThuA domain-containing protein n=1 Tax=Rhodopirellula halodulae TaxID=2894198 RepID=A0ABS8NMQ6_9BACT|nr:PVC-type heme-binding CxxCH protein [Rhodopirellula sp. JC740]MCC9644796.1 ThuA domain-containing protein [Rhodopirellula sp. JC740]